MNQYYINISHRFKAAFGAGVETPALQSVYIDRNENDFYLERYGETSPEEVDKVVFSFETTKLTFNDMLQGDTNGIFAPPLLLSFSKEKEIIETKVKGSDNIVVERWGTTPYTIDIRGILIDTESRKYPSSQIEALHDCFQHNDVIEVIGEQFFDKDIDTIYLTSFTISPVEGFSDTIQFNLVAKSIKAVNYTLLNPSS